MESALFKRSRIHTVLKKKVGSRYPTFISNSADPTFYTIRIRLSAQTPSEKKVESALFEKKSDPHGLKKKSDPDIRLSFQTVRIRPSFTQYESDFLLKQWGSKFLLKRSVLSQNPGSGSKFNVFGSTTLMSFNACVHKSVLWIQIHWFWIRIRDFGSIWIRIQVWIQGYTINFERKIKIILDKTIFFKTVYFLKLLVLYNNQMSPKE